MIVDTEKDEPIVPEPDVPLWFTPLEWISLEEALERWPKHDDNH